MSNVKPHKRTTLALPLASLSLCIAPVVSACASIGVSYGIESAYNAAFRTKIEDVSKKSTEDQLNIRSHHI
jgi:hypothetical protein